MAINCGNSRYFVGFWEWFFTLNYHNIFFLNCSHCSHFILKIQVVHETTCTIARSAPDRYFCIHVWLKLLLFSIKKWFKKKKNDLEKKGLTNRPLFPFLFRKWRQTYCFGLMAYAQKSIQVESSTFIGFWTHSFCFSSLAARSVALDFFLT